MEGPSDADAAADEAAAEIRAAWRRSVGDVEGADRAIDDVIGRHRERHRRYHTLEHVRWVVRHATRLAAVVHGGAGEPEPDTNAITVAAIFHDAVYDPLSSTNEHDSARLAAEHLRNLGWPTDRIRAVERMIEATAGHDARTLDEQVLLDADLAVLGGSTDDYAAYVAAVRAEYAAVDDVRWRAGRADVLRHFLDRPQIFNTPTMRDEREAQARANLAAELTTLER